MGVSAGGRVLYTRTRVSGCGEWPERCSWGGVEGQTLIDKVAGIGWVSFVFFVQSRFTSVRLFCVFSVCSLCSMSALWSAPFGLPPFRLPSPSALPLCPPLPPSALPPPHPPLLPHPDTPPEANRRRRVWIRDPGTEVYPLCEVATLGQRLTARD